MPYTEIVQTEKNTHWPRSKRKQCGAICYRLNPRTKTPEVSLLTSRDTGRWVIPKGWEMKKKSLRRAAKIEAWEEAGIKGKISKDPIGKFNYVKNMDDETSVVVSVEVFLLRVTGTTVNYPEKGQRNIKWVTFDVAVEMVNENGLQKLFGVLSKISSGSLGAGLKLLTSAKQRYHHKGAY